MKRYKIEFSLQSALMLFAVFISIYVAYIIRDILLLLFFAFIINSGLRPLVDRLHERKIPRALSILIIYLLVFGVLALIFTLIITQLIDQANDLVDSLPQFVENTLNTIRDEVPGAEEYLDNNDINTIVADVQEALTGSSDLSEIDTSSVFSLVIDLFDILRVEGLSIFESITGVFFSAFIVIITSVYMLSRKDDIYEGIVKLLPVETGKDVTRVLKKIEIGLGEWLIALLSVMFIIGVLAYLIVLLPGFFLSSEDYELARFAIIIGLTSGIMEVIPQLGAIIAFIMAVGLAILTGAALPIILYIVVMFLLLQQIEGLLISPIVMKSVVDVDPVISIFAVLAGFQLGGALMAVLAIPLVVTLQIILEEVSGSWRDDKEKQKVIKDISQHKGVFDEDQIKKEDDKRDKLLAFEEEHSVLDDLRERWNKLFS